MTKRRFLSKMFLLCVFYYVALLALVVNHLMPFSATAYGFSSGVVERLCEFCDYDRLFQWYVFIVLIATVLALPVVVLRVAVIIDDTLAVDNLKRKLVSGI